jgi:polyhydroxybutyrate depolymerase
MGKYRFRSFVLVFAMLITGGCDIDAGRENLAPDDSSRLLRRVIVHDGIEREYFVRLPAGATVPMPVVLAIHGYTSTATGFETAHGLKHHADAKGYLVVYPQGSHFPVDVPEGSSYRVTSWNDLAANLDQKPEGPHCVEDAAVYPCPPECGSCNRCSWTSCYDDAGFIEMVLDAVEAEFPTDPQRYYMLGVSNGGMMALRLGCNLSARFAAIAPIIAQLAPGYACGPSVSLPMLHLYGGKDNTVRYDGLPGGDGFIYTTAAQSTKVWAEAMSCKQGPKPWENEYSKAMGLVCIAYADCEAPGHEVVSCMDPEGGHDWPGQRIRTIPATCVTPEQYESMPDQARCTEASGEVVHAGMDLVWNFFGQYRRSIAN